MAGKKIDLGPTGESVAANVARLLTDANLTYAELSRRLERVGRPIPPLGLRRIVAGDRRVDVDDLTALAVALKVSPITLVMPDTKSADDEVRLTGMQPVGNHEGPPAKVVWQWLRGDQIMHVLGGGSTDNIQVSFVLRSAPDWLRARLDEQMQMNLDGDHGND